MGNPETKKNVFFESMRPYLWIGIVWCIVCCLKPTVTYAGKLDSLYQLAQTETNPVLKSDAYLAFLWSLSRVDRDSTERLLSQYEKECVKNSFPYGGARAVSMRAYLGNFENRYEEGFRLLHGALKTQREIRDTFGAALTLNRIGLIHIRFKRFDDAYRYLNLALGYFTQIRDSAKIDMVLNNLGVMYADQGLNENARYYYKKSLAIRESMNDMYKVGYSYFNIAETFMQEEQTDSGKYYMEESMRVFFAHSGNAPAMVFMGMGQMYLNLKQPEKALPYLNKGLEGAREINQTELLELGNQLLSETYARMNRYKEAYETQNAYLEIKREKDSTNNAARVAEIEERYKNAEKEVEIAHLTGEKLESENKLQQLRLYLLAGISFMLLLAAGIGILWMRSNQREKINRSVLNTRIAEAKMFALRAQMNPHFIFNCINTAQSFVMNNQQKEAYEYLSDFAQLLRLVMENSAKTYISLEDELQQIRLYLELESIRFRNKFSYTIKLDSELGNGVYEIPGMLIQPIIENAIGHGLINRPDDQGKLIVQFKLAGECIVCEITDNGVGRERAAAIKAGKVLHYASAAIPNINERLLMLQKETGLNVSMVIEDLKDQQQATGTRVVLTVPYR